MVAIRLVILAAKYSWLNRLGDFIQCDPDKISHCEQHFAEKIVFGFLKSEIKVIG